MRARFRPTSWLFANAHAQILLTFLVPQSRAVHYRRELLRLRDGGQAALDWALPSASGAASGAASGSSPSSADADPLPDDAPVVVLLHGLTGSSAHLKSLSAAALRRGFRPVVVNKRGHGGVALATPRLQAFGCVRDLQDAVAHIEAQFPRARHRAAIGLSAGAGLLVSYLGETGAASRLDASVLVSPGYDAYELFCRGGMSATYDFLMTFSLKALLLRHAWSLRHVVDLPGALCATSIREFDRRVFARMHGFGDDLDGYWRANNPVRALENVEKPVLCINALDDPVCRREGILYDVIERNPRAMLLETAHGSHCAFFHRGGGDKDASGADASWIGLVDRSWADEAALEYLTLVRAFQDEHGDQTVEQSA